MNTSDLNSPQHPQGRDTDYEAIRAPFNFTPQEYTTDFGAFAKKSAHRRSAFSFPNGRHAISVGPADRDYTGSESTEAPIRLNPPVSSASTSPNSSISSASPSQVPADYAPPLIDLDMVWNSQIPRPYTQQI
ncbi:hypothetical protein BABINDRAFT_168971 [Babjeviella inositovora NRRL Y-12698]|uniref:Uncharacterized protein n=1 Tax=Babjeviella inositovora NRRL Y-12698 TaxID=984486 RepID=A0A1E3QIX2_9ASCO|nr:uncharacterized protein BABINDRAFT_168971 [Babjeviella inositovora NRRL Y-12698]ODQ77656.1 hypothetical protein BABINDRAFT_168971 [Babjeviella inositovora NRRL Y-12698]